MSFGSTSQEFKDMINGAKRDKNMSFANKKHPRISHRCHTQLEENRENIEEMIDTTNPIREAESEDDSIDK